MNERPSSSTFREGFVTDEPPQSKQITPPQQKAAEPPPKPSSAMPPPEIAPALSEEDNVVEIVADKWPIVVKLLYKPLDVPGMGTLDELSFREPRAGDINRYGNPCRVGQDGDVLIEERKMHFIMANLCGIQPPILELMDPRDWNSCAYRLRHFFAPDLRAWLPVRTKRSS